MGQKHYPLVHSLNLSRKGLEGIKSGKQDFIFTIAQGWSAAQHAAD